MLYTRNVNTDGRLPEDNNPAFFPTGNYPLAVVVQGFTSSNPGTTEFKFANGERGGNIDRTAFENSEDEGILCVPKAGEMLYRLADGTAFEMERGFHAFFRQYYNLQALLRRIDGELSFLEPLEDYPILGPRGLMPNPKTGTVTPDVVTAVNNAKAGQVRFRTDKAGIIHSTIGKADFEVDALKANLTALLADLVKLKPASSKGHYLKKVSVSTTMGPGIIVDNATLDL